VSSEGGVAVGLRGREKRLEKRGTPPGKAARAETAECDRNTKSRVIEPKRIPELIHLKARLEFPFSHILLIEFLTVFGRAPR
jgi:hypothetical protein